MYSLGRLIMTLISVFAFVVSVHAPMSLAQQPAERPLTTVRFMWGKQVSDGGYFLLPGLVKRHGVDIKLVVFRRYPEALIALATGEVDIAHMGYPQAISILDQGIKNVKVIAGQGGGGTDLVVSKEVKVTDWKDLEGKKIGIFPGGPGDLNFRSSLGRHNVDISKVQVVKLTAPGAPLFQALKRREIDGYVAWEPVNATPVVEGYGYYAPVNLMDNETRGVNGLIAVNTGWASKNPDVVVSFLKATLEGQRRLLGQKDEWARTASEQLGIPLEMARESIKHLYLEPNLELRLKEAQAMARLMKEYGMVQKDWSAELPSVFDYSFLEKATGKQASELGRQ